MRYIDISQIIVTGMKKYPPDPAVKVFQLKSLKRGDSCNLLKLSFGIHTGTHVDAPSHILREAKTIDNINIKNLIRDVIVTYKKDFMTKEFFAEISQENIKGILLKKGRPMSELTVKEAKMLVDSGMKLIRTELLSIEKSLDKSHPVHRLLLSSSIVIIEGLNLKKVTPGHYKLICLPLKIKNGDGAPARTILAYG